VKDIYCTHILVGFNIWRELTKKRILVNGKWILCLDFTCIQCFPFSCIVPDQYMHLSLRLSREKNAVMQTLMS